MIIGSTARRQDWLTEAVTTQKQIESTTARIRSERERGSAAGLAVLDGNQNFDAGDWDVRPKATNTGDHRVISILWRLDAIMWRLDIVNAWLDAVVSRSANGIPEKEKEKTAHPLAARPSVVELGVIFLEIKTYTRQVKDLIIELRNSWRRRAIPGLAAVAITIAACGVGYALGSHLGNWASP